MKRIRSSHRTGVSLMFWFAFFSLWSFSCRMKPGDSAWLSSLYDEGRKIFYQAVKEKIKRHPLRDQLNPQEIEKMITLEKSYPRVYGILVNLYYQKEEPVFAVLLEDGKEQSKARFRDSYLDLVRFSAHNLVESLFISSPNVDFIREVQSRFKGKDRVDLILLSMGYSARLDIPKVEKPDDPLSPEFEKQWGLDAGRFRQAHQITKGSSAKIAVIDSGIDTNHPVFENTLFGKHFSLVGRDGPPWEAEAPAVDWGWHGTVVSSIVACYAPEARITLYKGMDADTMNDAPYPLLLAHFMAACIYKAVHDGNDVINISAGVGNDFQYVREACRYAYDNNVIIVAASPYYLGKYLGNNNNFPGGYDTTISVTGIDRLEEGKYGYWEIAAPEVTTTVGAPCAPFVAYPTYEEEKDEYAPGISCATPIVTCAVALAVSRFPRLGTEERGEYFEIMKDLLIKNANPEAVGFSGFSPECGYGLVDAEKTVRAAVDLQARRLAVAVNHKIIRQ